MIRRVVPWKEALIISLLLIVFMFPFVAQYRSIIGYQYYVTGDIDILGAMKGFISLLSSGKIDILDGIHQTMNRNADIVPVAAIIRDTPRYIDFQYGRTYLGLLFFFIPRVIWPEKPSLLTAVWTTERYLGINPYNYSIAPTTLFGEFYLNFGELGVFFGMAVWGMFLRFIYSYTKPACSKNASYLIFYVFMSVYFLWVSQTAAVTIVAIRAWIIIYFVSAIIKAFSPRKSLLAK
jgi:oligosaccharide repeat unit polymerase